LLISSIKNNIYDTKIKITTELKDLVQNEIETPDGVAILEQIYVTELGHIMMRLYYRDRKIWINKKVSTLEELLTGTNLKKTDKFTIKRF
jgi:hypothetical protein